MNGTLSIITYSSVSAGCHINDVMNLISSSDAETLVSAGCHINDVMNICDSA